MINSSGFSVVLPVYNESQIIIQTIDDLKTILKNSKCRFEIIAVDDGSSDGTRESLAQFDDITILSHPKNRGYGAALKTGISHAKYPFIVITDADGTYPNQDIPKLISIAQNYDMVVGARIGQNVQYSKVRKLPKFFLVHFAQWVTNQTIPDLNSGLRVFKKDVVNKFINILPDGFSFTTTITIAMLTNQYLVYFEPIDYHMRIGKSKIKPIRDTLRFIQIILRTGVYFAPIRIFMPIALIFFLGFSLSLSRDVFVYQDLTESTLILFTAFAQITMFTLLADMFDKRISRL